MLEISPYYWNLYLLFFCTHKDTIIRYVVRVWETLHCVYYYFTRSLNAIRKNKCKRMHRMLH